MDFLYDTLCCWLSTTDELLSLLHANAQVDTNATDCCEISANAQVDTDATAAMRKATHMVTDPTAAMRKSATPHGTRSVRSSVDRLDPLAAGAR